MRKLVKGEMLIILAEYPDSGFTSIAEATLLTKVGDIFTPEQLLQMQPNYPTGFQQMTLIALIHYDIAHQDLMGWKQHNPILIEDGYPPPPP